MKHLQVIAFLLFLALSEVLLVPFPFALMFLVIWQQLYSESDALVYACIAGIFLDIFFIRTLGTTSLIFMILLFTLTLYKRKYSSENILFVACSMFLSVLFIEYLFTRTIAPLTALVSGAITVILTTLIAKSRSKYESWYG